LVSLLIGDAPYARVYIPASQRTRFELGDTLRVTVQGVAQPFTATLSSIRREASFTPYFALSGDDASRLMYRAELRLQGEGARRLPAGLPLSAERDADAQH
jgi:HlyD family secretion protein